MSPYYRPKRTRNIYKPQASKPFKLSRSKIDLFIECPRCFYVDRRLGVGRPPSFPFNLNSAVDTLLKKEFDHYRAKREPHPLMTENGIDARPHHVDQLDKWRQNFTGVEYLHVSTNLLIHGAIDDLWINGKKELIVVDYKATSNKERIDRLNDTWHISYKRQIEIYQWLIVKNGFRVSNTGYFVYCNGRTNRESFEQRLEFDINLIPYEGDYSWIERTITEAHNCLNGSIVPEGRWNCDYCRYRDAAYEVVEGHLEHQQGLPGF